MSAAERVCDCDEGVQCPNERKPIFFMRATYCYPGWFATVVVLSRADFRATPPKTVVIVGVVRMPRIKLADEACALQQKLIVEPPNRVERAC